MNLVSFIIRIYHDARSPDRESGHYTSCELAFRTETAPFWVITQRLAVISYRRFGTILWSHLQGSKIQNDWKKSPLLSM